MRLKRHNKPRKHKPTGTVIHGTAKLEDLLAAFLGEADGLELSAGDRAIVGEMKECTWVDDKCTKCKSDLTFAFESLQCILTQYAEPYCYFGVHEGNGSDFGWWINTVAIEDGIMDGEIVELVLYKNGETVLKGAQDADPIYRLIINDHGNRTLQHRSNGRVIWEVV